MVDERAVSAFPNPFTTSTTISLILPSVSGDELVEILIYDISGKLIKAMEERTDNGKLSITWNGENESGEATAKGTYLIMVKSKSYIQTLRVIKQ